MRCDRALRVVGLAALMLLAGRAAAVPVTSAFTYQGELQNAGVPANGLHDLRFELYDAASGGSLIGAAQCVDEVNIVDGRFSVLLDFGTAAFAGERRFLVVMVRSNFSPACSNLAGYTTLFPRQEVTVAPQAWNAVNAQNAISALVANSASTASIAGNAGQLNGLPPSFYTNAANLNAGTLPVGRLGTTVVQTNTSNTITGVNTFSNTANTFFGNGSNLTGLWKTSGNLGTNPTTNFLGTTDNAGLTIRANNQPAVRITPFGTDTHSIVMGSASNTAGVFVGATIGGGGSEFPMDERNQVTGDFGTVAGGLGNTAARSGFVGGGFLNRAGTWASVAGGSENWAQGQYSAVAGGQQNRIQSPNLNPAPPHAFIGGGTQNIVEGTAASILGGQQNEIRQNAFTSAILGGAFNRVEGQRAVVVGGLSNIAGGDASVVMGSNARTRTPTQTGDADGDEGTFVFADATGATFTSTGPNQFLIRAAGGVGIGTNAPLTPFHVEGGTLNVARVDSSNTSSFAAAVVGQMTSTSPGGFSAGVRGNNAGTGGNGVGVYGSHSGNGYGVYGVASGSSGLGVVGSANATTGWAGFFFGRANVTGAFSAGSKAFRIDHPLDPANKELWHSCVESPEMLNLYTGTTTTDGAGYATVTLPEYFEALNTTFTYHLTVVDSNPDIWTLAKVTREISENSFEIRTSSPETTVSWMVTGVRNDAYARRHRIIPEVDKGERKGTYLHPEAFGMPATLRSELPQQAQ